ncbi:MAG: IclR family transcriptional regulator C-terminal domain-containing protein, partial [Solirubrobacteraceae bacterium]
ALEVGSLVPAHASALGKALLAHHAYVLPELGAAPLASYTPATVTDIKVLTRELEEIRQLGWASEVGELFPGIASLAAPIEDRRGVIAGAIGISGPIERLWKGRRPRPELVADVMQSARTVSRELGAIPW